MRSGTSGAPLTCLSSSVLSMILMLIIRYISALLVWILTSLVVLGSLGELTSCLYNPLSSLLSSLPVCITL